MQITRLYAANFLSYESLDLPLADRGLVLIDGENQDTGGSNGAGKSAIFEALTWGLFGATNRGLRGDEVVRRNESRDLTNDTMVCVEISVDGKFVQVFRHRNHKQHKNKLLLFVDKNEITMGSDKETQERLHSLLQIDREAFVAAVMFPQGAEGFASLTDAGQKAILDRILGTERFAEAQLRVKEKLKKLTLAVAKAESTTAAAEKHVQTSELWVKETGNQLTLWAAEQDAKKQVLKDSLAKLELERPAIDMTLEATLASLRASGPTTKDFTDAGDALHTASIKRDNARSALEKARGRHECALAHRPVSRPEPPTATSKHSEAKENAKQWGVLHGKRSEEMSMREGHIAALRIQLDKVIDNCPTCGQLLPEEVRTQTRIKLSSQIDEINAVMPSLQEKIDEGKKNYNAWLEEVNKAFDHESWVNEQKLQSTFADALNREAETLNRLSLEIGPLEVAAQELREKFDAIRQRADELSALNTQLLQQQAALSSWETKVAQFKGSLAAVETNVNPYVAILAEKREQFAKAKNDVVRSQALQEVLSSELRYLSFWETGFGNNGVKSLLLDTVVPFLTNRASQYLGMLTNDLATIEFQTQTTLGSGETREKFCVNVNYLYGGDSYESVSGGERRRVDLASLFALGDLAASRSLAPIKLRLLDEPFDNLDALGSEQVVQILREIVLPTAGTVLVMTHDDNLKALIENRITVVKKDGISRIQEV